MDKDPVVDAPGNEKKPKLTIKQAKFAAAYLDPAAANGNGTLAAKLAGYKGGAAQLAVQSSVNLRHQKIQQVIFAGLKDMIPHALTRLREALDATKSEKFLNKAGAVVTSPPEPDAKIRLKAFEIILETATKCNRGAYGLMGDESGAGAGLRVQDLSEDDLALHHQPADTEAELTEMECELAEGDNGAPDGAERCGTRTAMSAQHRVESRPDRWRATRERWQ